MNKPFIKNIIVAISGSQSSIQAAMYGIIMAKQYSLSMKAVFVVDTAAIRFLTNSKFFASSEKEAYLEDLNADGKRYLDYVNSLALSKGMKIETELRSGAVWAEIINAADDYEADVILLGGHNSEKTYMSDKEFRHNIHITARSEIVEYAHCPVLVVHKPKIEELFKIS